MIAQELFSGRILNRSARPVHHIAAAGVCSILWCAAAQGAVAPLVANLRSGQEVPPNASAARGCGRFEIDTIANTLKYHISFGGLSAAETAAHIHGVAAPGVNAGVLHPLPPGNPKVGVW